MAGKIPLIPKVGNILIQSGNIVHWNRLKRKPKNTTTDEICECISGCIEKYLETADTNQLQYANELVCENKQLQETLPVDEREDFKVTVKVIVHSHQNPQCIHDAVEKAMSALGVNFVETVLLAIPDPDEEMRVEDIKPCWQVLESLVEQNKVLSLGICDLDKIRFEQLYEWATIKPSIDQVNLASCCVMPEDLRNFAKEHVIQLLTHSDPPDVLPLQTLQDAIRRSSTDRDGDYWEPSWISRYSVIIKCRGIIKTKGYVISLTRDIKRRS